MRQISFPYPFLVMQKCKCRQQIPIKRIFLNNCLDGIKISWKVTCTCCGNEMHKTYEINGKNDLDLSHEINAYEIIPSIKDEIIISKLETFKAKLKNGTVDFFGNYSRLRLFDNVIEDGIISLEFLEISKPYVFLMEQ
ncbi:MAG: hypothetical protein GX893_08555 [Firmicutes bacterium]|nr:hypothetical protein [Bacillota bacterium]NLZ39637.1 hypothetical protein [Bacillota bacterium]